MKSPPTRVALAWVLTAIAVVMLLHAFWPQKMPLPIPRPPPPGITTAPDELAMLVSIKLITDEPHEPLDLRVVPGDPATLFVVEKAGRIVVLRDGHILPKPVLDIGPLITHNGERGLLGLAFHPEYTRNHLFYVNYTDVKGDHRVVEYRTDRADHADPSSARVVFALPQPYANHNGGNLAFGRDGLLYIGLGDGGSGFDPQNRSQNDHEMLGKMLALDVNAANPMPVVMAKGLRNPWRYSFDRQTGDLYIADVGQNEWEEVDVVAAGHLKGLNFGWRILEGTHCLLDKACSTDGLVLPDVEYGHKYGCSVTGGFVYRGKALPELSGTYFYSDFCSGFLRSFRWKDGHTTEAYDWLPALGHERLVHVDSFGEGADGELYIISLDGPIWRLERK